MSMARYVMVVLMLLGLVGCGSTKLVTCEDGRDPLWFSSVSQRMLERGTMSYERGNYAGAMTQLQSVLDYPAATDAEKIESYKLLAFMHCVSGREKMCSDSFKKAIQLNANFELTPAEVGHPVWGPVFRATKKSSAK